MTLKPGQRKRYKLPEQSISGVSYSDYLSDIISLRIIFDRLGIRTQNTRIERYHNYLEAIINQDESAKSKIFKGIKNYEFDNDLDRQLYVIREIHELVWILRGLKVHMPKGIEDKLNEIVGGRDFAALDSNSASRNTQFELRIASYFCQKKYKVDLSTETDIVASRYREVYFVECKRVASNKSFVRRINDSRKQIDLRLPRNTWNKKHFAMMAIDITKLAFSHNGLTFGYTSEQTKDIIQDKLIKISNAVDSSKCFGDNKNILLLWLQIHIPALVVYPPTVISRFSSLAIVNPDLCIQNKKSFEKLQQVLRVGELGDPREIATKKLIIPLGITIPKGTTFCWDEKLLLDYLSTLELQQCEPEHIVLSLKLDSNEYKFTYYELLFLISSLNESQKLELQQNQMRARVELAAMLYFIRYPYENA